MMFCKVQLKIRVVMGAMLVGLTLVAQAGAAEQNIVSWTGDYLWGDDSVKGKGNRWYRGQTTSVPKLTGIDVDGDGNSADDSVLYYDFSLTQSLVPPAGPVTVVIPDGNGGTKEVLVARYLVEEPSAIFYGGIVGRFGNRTPANFDQATIEDSGRNPLVTDNRFPGSVPWRELIPNPKPVNGFDSEITLFVDDGPFTGNQTDEADDVSAFNAVFLWKTDPVSLGSGDTMRVDLTRHWAGVEGRFVIGQNGQFYVSQTTLADLTNNYNTLVNGNSPDFGARAILDLLDEQWAEYDPSTVNKGNGIFDPFAMDFDQNSAVFAPMQFTSADYFGLYLERDALSTDSALIVFDNFFVTVAVPTPGSALLAAPLAIVMLLRRRR